MKYKKEYKVTLEVNAKTDFGIRFLEGCLLSQLVTLNGFRKCYKVTMEEKK